MLPVAREGVFLVVLLALLGAGFGAAAPEQSHDAEPTAVHLLNQVTDLTGLQGGELVQTGDAWMSLADAVALHGARLDVRPEEAATYEMVPATDPAPLVGSITTTEVGLLVRCNEAWHHTGVGPGIAGLAEVHSSLATYTGSGAAVSRLPGEPPVGYQWVGYQMASNFLGHVEGADCLTTYTTQGDPVISSGQLSGTGVLTFEEP